MELSGGVGEAGVVKLELLDGSAELLIVRRVNGVYACEDHGFDLGEAVDGRGARAVDVCDGVTDLDLAARLDAGDDVSHVARRERLPRLHVEPEHAHLVGVVLLACCDELDEVAR